MLGNTAYSQRKGLGNTHQPRSYKPRREISRYLLHHSIWLELVTVGQTSYKTSLTMLIKTKCTRLALWPAETLMLLAVRILTMLINEE